MRYALGYKGDLAGIAMRIKHGQIRTFDLIGCGPQKQAYMASVGLEGALIQMRDRRRRRGESGFYPYLHSFINAYGRCYRGVNAEVTCDGRSNRTDRVLSVIVMKQPYYGYGMKVAPRARFDDGLLHVITIQGGWLRPLLGLITAFTVGNRIGRYQTCRHVRVTLDETRTLQTDGSTAWESDQFSFHVLPKAVKFKV
jgi:diacylglycerol kinase family enzyme